MQGSGHAGRGAGDDRAGVHAAAQAGPEGRITAQAQGGRRVHQGGQLLGRIAAGRFLPRAEAPESAPPLAVPPQVRHAVRGNGADVRECGRVGAVGHRALRIAGQLPQVGLMLLREGRQDGLGLRREGEAGASAADDQRFDAETVARQGQDAVPGVPYGQRPHAVEPVETAIAPAKERLQGHLRIARGPEGRPGGFQFAAELHVIVNLAVVDDMVPAGLVRHRLMGLRSGIDDFEATVGQAEVSVHPISLAIRSAMRQGVRHAFESGGIHGPAVQVPYSGNAAHRYRHPSFRLTGTVAPGPSAAKANSRRPRRAVARDGVHPHARPPRARNLSRPRYVPELMNEMIAPAIRIEYSGSNEAPGSRRDGCARRERSGR